MLAGCETPPAPPPPAPPPPTPTPITPRDAAVPVDAAIVSSTTPRWVLRVLDVGMVPFPQRAETFTLRRDDGRAVLEIGSQKAISKDLMNVSGWEPPTFVTHTGTATEGATVTIDLGAFRLDCKMAKEKVAAATALRRPSPRRPNSEACGDRGRWVPTTLTTIDVLRCEVPEALKKRRGEVPPYLAFAPAPGIEWLYVNDDCAMQGGGWRLIPEDQSIAAFRSG